MKGRTKPKNRVMQAHPSPALAPVGWEGAACWGNRWGRRQRGRSTRPAPPRPAPPRPARPAPPRPARPAPPRPPRPAPPACGSVYCSLMFFSLFRASFIARALIGSLQGHTKSLFFCGLLQKTKFCLKKKKIYGRARDRRQAVKAGSDFPLTRGSNYVIHAACRPALDGKGAARLP